ncbi:probable inactive serine/threonine-protein kinase bub1 isoform X2 [Chenopodium quinoa]|uniref:probable inactive serine/threonine-protein kinase bub1 isoform X2 n=1 Tax=Chenopodium quinoa TaxID=63459 RepID=UPI000B77A00D|nr:probable inactive serine/threonine-protein kinase bub1 isoform X2 [Chenopodium quinoa]
MQTYFLFLLDCSQKKIKKNYIGSLAFQMGLKPSSRSTTLTAKFKFSLSSSSPPPPPLIPKLCNRAKMASTNPNDLFSSLISDIKSYSGNDPLLPWISGVRKMKNILPPHLLKEKLPRFLQKCAQTFDSNRRYRNDLRYLRIWLQLMDFVDDPKALLRTMEMKKIGTKRALFYQAYALYYEKIKKFDDAEKLYHLGVQNLAEPLDELQKSYEQFIQRMKRHRNKRVQREERRTKRPLSDHNTTDQECPQNTMPLNEAKENAGSKLYRDDSVVAKFVDSAIVGRSEAEDACHHGLVEPTINMKEAMNAINSMFKEPIEPANFVRKTYRGQHKVDQSTSNVLEVFIDENSDNKVGSTCQSDKEKFIAQINKADQPPQEPLKIFVDDEMSNDSEPSETQTSADDSPSSSSRVDAFVFLRPQDHQSESSNEMKVDKSSRKTRTKFREDTVVRRFVGSAILDEPEVENICHHGLVDPTVNLKEAMEDINGMFGKPIDFVRTTRRKRQEKAAVSENNDFGGFSILADDEFNHSEGPQPPRKSSSKDNLDLHEPTIFTKEAMDDINDLFKMPLDF